MFKSSVGVGELRSTPLSHSFCRHVVESGAPLEVVDARLHPKVRDNPSIEDYGIVAYLGMPLTTSTGERLGALCAIDHSRASGAAATTACSRTSRVRRWPRSSCGAPTARSQRPRRRTPLRRHT